MQHRRAASDTTAFLFNRVAMSELLKDGPSSDHSSRSMTPLFSSLNKSAGELFLRIILAQFPTFRMLPHVCDHCMYLIYCTCVLCFFCHVEAISHPFGSHHKLDQSPKKQVSPHTQQKASQVHMKTSKLAYMYMYLNLRNRLHTKFTRTASIHCVCRMSRRGCVP